MLAVVILACTLGGLAIGSFLNVVIYRVPVGMSVVSPPSACPACGSPVLPRDNIPVLSWLILRGRCRRCASRISARYPLIEGLTALVFALIAVRMGVTWSLLPELGFAGGLIALASVDAERYLLPRAILYPTALIVFAGLLVASGFEGRWEHLGVALLCAAVAFGIFFAINFIRPAWMGFGDVRLAGLIGLALGWLGPWYVLIGFMIANIVGALLGITLMALGLATRRTALPYGVFLAGGSILAILVGGPVIHWYHTNLIR
jgi:leader peptidase (prepilin peptidase)/N-methyltransferase